MMHEKAYYFYATEFYKRVQGTLIIDGVGGLDRENIGGELEVKWGQFLHHLTFNLTHAFACQRKQIHPLHPGFGILTIRPLCLE